MTGRTVEQRLGNLLIGVWEIWPSTFLLHLHQLLNEPIRPPPSGLDMTGHFSSAQVQVTRQVKCYLGCQAAAEKNPADESIRGLP